MQAPDQVREKRIREGHRTMKRCLAVVIAAAFVAGVFTGYIGIWIDARLRLYIPERVRLEGSGFLGTAQYARGVGGVLHEAPVLVRTRSKELEAARRVPSERVSHAHRSGDTRPTSGTIKPENVGLQGRGSKHDWLHPGSLPRSAMVNRRLRETARGRVVVPRRGHRAKREILAGRAIGSGRPGRRVTRAAWSRQMACRTDRERVRVARQPRERRRAPRWWREDTVTRRHPRSWYSTRPQWRGGHGSCIEAVAAVGTGDGADIVVIVEESLWAAPQGMDQLAW